MSKIYTYIFIFKLNMINFKCKVKNIIFLINEQVKLYLNIVILMILGFRSII